MKNGRHAEGRRAGWAQGRQSSDEETVGSPARRWLCGERRARGSPVHRLGQGRHGRSRPPSWQRTVAVGGITVGTDRGTRRRLRRRLRQGDDAIVSMVNARPLSFVGCNPRASLARDNSGHHRAGTARSRPAQSNRSATVFAGQPASVAEDMGFEPMIGYHPKPA
jgi:hypothetical protein